ncbi:MAG: YicC/YloC family endoribonuclease [Saprospiraceae bacterium]|nr:YicC/YloC family endoribonuclease [Saprospiraceae bacterium]
MLLSMTGYGRETLPYKDKTITVEIRSLNSKFTDVRLKIPQNFKEKETELRRIIAERVERGKIELSIDVKSHQGDDEYGLNHALFKKYYRELSKLCDELGMQKPDMLQAILRLPNVVSTDAEEIEEEEWAVVLKAMDSAIGSFDKFRLAEGNAMEEDMRTRVKLIRECQSHIDPHEGERVVRLRQRLHQNLEEYLGKEKIDENRFEQEILFYLEKMDITEEKVRLEQHCLYFLEELDKKEKQKGRKLSFITQEMGREINTLGAKAYSSEIQRYVVSMKDELEKIKEQVANSV